MPHNKNSREGYRQSTTYNPLKEHYHHGAISTFLFGSSFLLLDIAFYVGGKTAGVCVPMALVMLVFATIKFWRTVNWFRTADKAGMGGVSMIWRGWIVFMTLFVLVVVFGAYSMVKTVSQANLPETVERE